MKKQTITLLKELGYSFMRKMLFFIVIFWCKFCKKFQQLFCKKRAVVALYHRIAVVGSDPTLLCVTPETFEKHLRFYRDNYNVITLAELIKKIKLKELTGNELTLTFDDGYQDNLLNALPLLEQYNLPATIFITTGNLGEMANFDWDKKYKLEDRAHFLSPKEIQTLSEHPLITIGAHTVNHIKLSTSTVETVRYELAESKKTLESMTEKPVDFFTYPFGGPLDFTRHTETLVKEAGFTAAIANNQLFATNHSRLTAVPRINVRNYTIEELKALIK